MMTLGACVNDGSRDLSRVEKTPRNVLGMVVGGGGLKQ